MDTDEAALLAAVLADPDADTPRLVYADWLDDHDGAGRAALIRKQVERSRREVRRGTDGRIDAAWDAWVMRSGEWAGRTGPRWVVSSSILLPVGGAATIRRLLPPGPDRDYARVWFARGFLDEAECPAAWWLAHGHAIRAAHPVRHVQFTDLSPFAARGTYRSLRDDSKQYRIDSVADVFAYLDGEWPDVEFGVYTDALDRLTGLARAGEPIGADF